jgi:putative ABC transport system permease protein
MSALRQIAAVSAINIRSLPHRIGTSSVVVIGIAGVVAVLISVLAMSTGFIKTLQSTGPEHRAVVVRTGSSAELVSVLTNDAALTIANAAGIKKAGDGRPLVSPETLLIMNLTKKDGEDATAPFRGFTQDGFAVHPEIKMISGRAFRPGVTEMIVGKSAQRLYSGLDIDARVKLRGSTWTVVGVFDGSGSSHDSELIADKQTLNSAYQRGDGEQSVWVVLDSQGSFQAFKDAITANPQLQVDVSTEQDFTAQQSSAISQILKVVAYVVGGIMAIGAIFGALNTMYSAVSTRSREIATLRAIGFGPTPVVISVFAEALLLALIGGSIGALIAWVLFNGYSVNSVGGGFGGQLIFDLAVTPALVGLGITWACVIGLIGGLFPAIRAARLPVATALRAV